GQREQHQRRRQQHAAGDRVVEAVVGAVDQPDRVVYAGDEVAQQQRRHVGVEALPEAGRARLGPEDQRQRGGDDAEDDDVIGDQGAARRGGCFWIHWIVFRLCPVRATRAG